MWGESTQHFKKEAKKQLFINFDVKARCAHERLRVVMVDLIIVEDRMKKFNFVRRSEESRCRNPRLMEIKLDRKRHAIERNSRASFDGDKCVLAVMELNNPGP
jgi:hypothetical protein